METIMTSSSEDFRQQRCIFLDDGYKPGHAGPRTIYITDTTSGRLGHRCSTARYTAMGTTSVRRLQVQDVLLTKHAARGNMRTSSELWLPRAPMLWV